MSTLPNLAAIRQSAIPSAIVLFALSQAFWGQPLRCEAAPTASEAIAQIEALGGVVRELVGEETELEIDFRFCHEPATDEQLQVLTHLPNIASLQLGGSAITDVGLEHIAAMTSVRRLSLEHTSITDAGCKHLAELKQLARLNLFGTKIGDDGLRQLRKLNQLRYLYVAETNVTSAAVAELRSALPELLVVPDHAEERRRAVLALELTKSARAEAQLRLAAAEKDRQELGSRTEELKKTFEAAEKFASDERRKADEFRGRTWQEARRKLEQSKREADEAERRSSSKPEDESLKQQAEQKRADASQVETRLAEIDQQLTALQSAADTARAQAAAARELFDRSRNSKRNHETAVEILKAAEAQSSYAESRLEGLP